VTDNVILGHTVSVKSLTAQQATALERSVLVNSVHKQRTARTILLAQQDRLNGAIQGESGQLLLVIHELAQAADKTVVSPISNIGLHRGRVQVIVSTERGTRAMQGRSIEIQRESLSDLLTE